MIDISPSNITETSYFNYAHSSVQAFVTNLNLENKSQKEQAIELYYQVRDGWRYNAYNISLSPKDYKASEILTRDNAHCIDKSTVLITFLRAFGIPAKLELAKIKNHLAVERLLELIGTDELVPHGYVSMYIEDRWIKVSPAFNKELCAIYNVAPLEFDGENDSILQEYNSSGSLFMEYLESYGAFDDVPVRFIFEKWKEHYPHLRQKV